MTSHHRHHHPHTGHRSAARQTPHVVARQPAVARETGAAYDAGAVGPTLRDAVQAASTWLQRVLDLAADGRVEGGELGALLDLLPALDRGHAAAVALTDTALATSLAERKAGINYDTLLAMRTRATYTERGWLQRLAQLLRRTPNLQAAYDHGLIGTGQLLTIAAEAKVLRGEALAAFDACFADPDELARLEPDQLVDLARVEFDRHRPDLAERGEIRTVERSYLHLQPCLDGSGEGHFAYDADSFSSSAGVKRLCSDADRAASLPPLSRTRSHLPATPGHHRAPGRWCVRTPAWWRRAGQAQQVSSSASARQDLTPSSPAMTATPRAATGSAHHHPSRAFAPSPSSTTPDSQAHSSVCRASETTAWEPSGAPRRRLARARIGISTSDRPAITMPTGLASGPSCERSWPTAS
jgi:hypothetical protein